MCYGLQGSKKSDGDRGQVNNLPKAIGFDAYNQISTGGIKNLEQYSNR